MIGQPIVQSLAKATTSAPTTPAIAKSKNNPYTNPEVDKCYRCGESGDKSNECPKRLQANIADYEEGDDVLIQTEPKDSDFINNMAILSLVLFRKCFAVRRSLALRRDINSSIQGV